MVKLTKELLRIDNASSSWLVFNGLDTFATIEVCNQVMGVANNQFRQWQFDISNALRSCKEDPIISINFGSAPEIANAIANETGQESEDQPHKYGWEMFRLTVHSMA